MTTATPLQSVRARTVTVAPIRLVLGLVWLAAARAAGATSSAALLAFAVGAIGFAVAALAHPRRRFLAPRAEPRPAPPGMMLDRKYPQPRLVAQTRRRITTLVRRP